MVKLINLFLEIRLSTSFSYPSTVIKFLEIMIKPMFLLNLKSKMCVLCFLHDRLLYIFDLFFNNLIIGVLIVNCVLYLVFFSKHSCFQGCIAYWCRISSILCLLCDSCFLHFESWYEVYCWHEIILFTDACFLNVLKISPSVPMV